MSSIFIGLQILGITGSSVLAGASAAQSILVVPSLKLADPPLLARQFSNLVEATTRIARAFGACTSVTIASLPYMSWSSSSSSLTGTARRSQQCYLFAIATAVCFGITPFSAISILPINQRMKELAEKGGSPGKMSELLGKRDEQEINELIEKWRRYNYIRCCFPLLGSIIALWASLS